MNSQQNTNMNAPHFLSLCVCVFFFLRMGDSGFFARLLKFLNTPCFFLCVCVSVCVCVFTYEWVTLASLRDFLSFSMLHVFFFFFVWVCVFVRMGDSGFFARLFKFLNTPRVFFFVCVCVCMCLCVFYPTNG